jgi:alpha-galactosidase
MIYRRFFNYTAKFIFVFIVIFSSVSAQTNNSNIRQPRSGEKLVAPVPPMGWNSWDCFGTTVTESDVKANAEYMAKHLLQYGWNYIIVDIQWYEPNAQAHGYRRNAELITDEYGRLLPAENRFSSSSGGKGFKLLADYIHNLGLKFGIHIMRGIPRQVVRQNLPIYNTAYKAQDIADTNSVCPWNTDMYSVKANTPGGQAYYDSIIKLYSEWGVDYIKADDMTAFSGNPADENRLNEIKALSSAIKKSGRKIVLSLSPGPASVEQAEFLQEHAQMWRISDDFWDKWSDIIQQFGFMRNWYKITSPGTWPDADMLPLGKIGIRAERGEPRGTNFTKDEQHTLISLWCMFRSPLMFGGNLPDNDEFTLSLITNAEVLEINQNSENNKEYYADENKVIWTANVPGTNELYIAVFNISDSELKDVKINLKELGVSSDKFMVRNLWQKKDIGEFINEYSVNINPHGCVLVKVKPI